MHHHIARAHRQSTPVDQMKHLQSMDTKNENRLPMIPRVHQEAFCRHNCYRTLPGDFFCELECFLDYLVSSSLYYAGDQPKPECFLCSKWLCCVCQFCSKGRVGSDVGEARKSTDIRCEANIHFLNGGIIAQWCIGEVYFGSGVYHRLFHSHLK